MWRYRFVCGATTPTRETEEEEWRQWEERRKCEGLCGDGGDLHTKEEQLMSYLWRYQFKSLGQQHFRQTENRRNEADNERRDASVRDFGKEETVWGGGYCVCSAHSFRPKLGQLSWCDAIKCLTSDCLTYGRLLCSIDLRLLQALKAFQPHELEPKCLLQWLFVLYFGGLVSVERWWWILGDSLCSLVFSRAGRGNGGSGNASLAVLSCK